MRSNLAKQARLPQITAVVTVLVVALALAPPAEAGKGGKKKIDLRVTRVDNRDFLVSPEKLRVEYSVRNSGSKRVEIATLKIIFRELIGELPVARPTFTETIDLFDLPPGRREDGAGKFDVPLGRYAVEACVKVRRDKRKGNNCANGKRFSVIPESWQVSNATSVAPLNNRPESEAVQASTAGAGTAFFLDGRTGDEFAYSVAGSVRFYAEGIDPEGCEWSGSKSINVSSDKLILSEDLLDYRFVPATFLVSYPATAHCPAPVGDVKTTLFSGPWLTGFPQTRSRSTESILSGTAPVIPGSPGSYAWSLSAK